MPCGTRSHSAALALPSSAHAPRLCRLITLSPIWNCVTPGPTATTMPAASPPGMNGGSGRNWYLPASIRTSTYCTPRASMRTCTSPGPGGGGSGTSRSANTSGPPNASHTTAFIHAIPCCRRCSIASSPARRQQHRPVLGHDQDECTDPRQARDLQQVGLLIDREGGDNAQHGGDRHQGVEQHGRCIGVQCATGMAE